MYWHSSWVLSPECVQRNGLRNRPSCFHCEIVCRVPRLLENGRFSRAARGDEALFRVRWNDVTRPFDEPKKILCEFAISYTKIVGEKCIKSRNLPNRYGVRFNKFYLWIWRSACIVAKFVPRLLIAINCWQMWYSLIRWILIPTIIYLFIFLKRVFKGKSFVYITDIKKK